MAYPATSQALRTVRQDTDSLSSESYTISAGAGLSYRLGTNATPALPAGWQDVPLGASPVPIPPAPTLTSQLTSARFGLATTGVYKYWTANRSKYGQTQVSATPLTVTLTGSNNGTQLALPAATPSAYNPVTSRVLYRSTNGGTTPYWLSDLDSVSGGAYTDTKADTELGDAAPASDTSGISPSPVTVVGPGSVTWTERPAGTTLSGLDFTVDYSSTASGGVVTFAAADVGKAVTITYTAATLLSDAPLNGIINAIKDLLHKPYAVSTGATLTAVPATPAAWPNLGTISLTLSASAVVRLRFTPNFSWLPGGSANLLVVLLLADGGTMGQRNLSLTQTSGITSYAPTFVATGTLAAGTHTLSVQFFGTSASGNIENQNNDGAYLEAEVIG